MANKIVEFQKNNGLVADGIIGRNTMNKMMDVFKIDSIESTAHFVGQLAHETANFKKSVESLNYSVSGLISTFSFMRKNPLYAKKYGRINGVQKADQVAIANLVYDDANRSPKYKLGNVEPGDGWKFRGRGAIMITGRNNYEAFFKWLGLCVDTDPDLVESKYYWETALWFFEKNKVWWHTNAVTFFNCKMVTKIINGGDNGLSHRWNLTEQYYSILSW